MRRVHWYPLLLMLLVPHTSSALQLRWSNGSTDLSFTSATRCTLVIQADLAESRLPAEWRLLWVADSLSIQFIAMDSLEACLLDKAQVSRIDAPATAPDSAANQITAYFCSDESNATVAQQVVDLPADGHGKLKIIMLDPTSSNIIESNEVRYNGGIEGAFPSVALAASGSHATNQFVVHAAGTGLADVVEVIAQAPDSLWSLPLQITEHSDSTLTAVAEVFASMPASVLRLTSAGGTVTVAALPADGPREGIDPDFEALAESCRLHHCYYFDPDPDVYPKDFAFFYAISQNPVRGLFHLFYIRNHKTVAPGSTTRSFGHAWSRDLRNWEADTSAAVFSVSSNAWDRAHVWAPSIAQVGPNYHMFYTGVDDQANPPTVIYGNQRIGYATTAAIDIGHATVWNRQIEPTYTVNRTNWARRDSVGTHRHQFRDPFIMADPDNVGRYLLFMVGDKDDGDYAVGVARNAPGTLDVWQDLGYYRSTDRDYSGDGQVVESVTVFPDSAYPGSKTSAQATWRLLFTHGINSPDDQTIRFSAKKLGTALGDTTLGPDQDRVWSTPATNLFTYLNGDSTAWGTYATEYLRAGGVDFLATFDGSGILVSRMLWDGTSFYLRQPPVMDVSDDPGRLGSEVAMRLAQAVPGAGLIRFAIQLPARQQVKLGIYDVAGRRVRSLIDGELPPGTIPLDWDGMDEAGNSVRTGMYFARLSGEFGHRIVRAAFIR
jgi:hypothetical protein